MFSCTYFSNVPGVRPVSIRIKSCNFVENLISSDCFCLDLPWLHRVRRLVTSQFSVVVLDENKILKLCEVFRINVELWHMAFR